MTAPGRRIDSWKARTLALVLGACAPAAALLTTLLPAHADAQAMTEERR